MASVLKAALYRLSETADFARSIFENRVFFEDSDKVQIAVLIQGGIGDAMIAARWLHRLIPKIRSGGDFALDIYYAAPESLEFIFGNFDCVRYLYHSITFHRVCRRYSLALIINHLGFLEASGMKPQEIAANRVLADLVAAWAEGIEAYRRFSRGNYRPPLMSPELAEFIRRRGFTRRTILEDQTGLEAPLRPFPFMLPARGELEERFPRLRGRYLTVHDGWDAQLKIGGRRPTKSYPVEKWRSLVRGIKDRFPEVAVVQLGGERGSEIPGVDLSLKGVVPLAAAVAVLQKSLVHVDTDSGLVHVAASLGTRTVALFGPTGIDFYGYPENANVRSSGCTNCWLSSGDWAATCLIGDRQPRCMTSIPEAPVMDAVAAAISAAG